MANSFKFKEVQYKVGDTLSINYRIKEGDKERLQLFKGVLIKIKGDTEANRMITVRKITKSAIGVERIIPLFSPYIQSMKLEKKSNFNKAKLYQTKKTIVTKKKTTAKK